MSQAGQAPKWLHSSAMPLATGAPVILPYRTPMRSAGARMVALCPAVAPAGQRLVALRRSAQSTRATALLESNVLGLRSIAYVREGVSPGRLGSWSSGVVSMDEPGREHPKGEAQ
eukprot:scaffold239171_cov33-Tisochrysis_lutea.AAC.2